MRPSKLQHVVSHGHQGVYGGQCGDPRAQVHSQRLRLGEVERVGLAAHHVAPAAAHVGVIGQREGDGAVEDARGVALVWLLRGRTK